MNDRKYLMKAQIGDVIRAWGEWITHNMSSDEIRSELNFDDLYEALDDADKLEYKHIVDTLYWIEALIVAIVDDSNSGWRLPK